MAPQSNQSSMESIDAYKVLGLCTDANARDVRSAFRRISLKLHPDRADGRRPSAGITSC